ncbi:CatA-like O-acetyltransferase [Clostridium transplantifaecale]|uniref:CatA-like O-acetyltransferase n=1 Tax=Clostridium transplantifaecale TaxID=2479838 RepID=UPI000F63D82B|nr:CatA-like O-acetyltransferase [Clostridium transplantifaecale]
MSYTHLDMDSYKRKNHFEYFNGLGFPYMGTTVNVDVTDFVGVVKQKKLPFFLSFCYCIARAANRVPELRQRIRDNRIIEFDNCRTSHTVAQEDGTYCYCTLDSSMAFEDYLPYAVRAQETARMQNSIEEEKEDTDELLFISTLPWFSFTSLIQPVPMPADSNPRITWGKYFEDNGKYLMPVSILCHHGLVDGAHLASFYRSLEDGILIDFSEGRA